MQHYLEFEKEIAELEAEVLEVRARAEKKPGLAVDDDLTRLEDQIEAKLKKLYRSLTPWQKTMVARHPDRPHCLQAIETLMDEFVPLAGDRAYREDKAIIGGLARFRGQPVVVIGQEKGEDTASRMEHNFGMAYPEGYRKVVRLMELANRFHLPVVAFVDTPGAFPGVEAEERGQAEAIARCIDSCLGLEVPNVAIILGEGGSGGAVALATANVVLMMEYAIYSVASPEASASILWRDTKMAETAARAMRITAQDLKAAGVIDAVIPEPCGGAHRAPGKALASIGRALSRALNELSVWESKDITEARVEKFMAMGRLREEKTSTVRSVMRSHRSPTSRRRTAGEAASKTSTKKTVKRRSS